MPNAWVTFVKEWVKENNIPYSQAVKDPRVSEAYKQSKTQTVARNVAQGKLSDIAERAKAMPPKAMPPKAPLPVRQVFDNPDIRKMIFDYKITPSEVESRKTKKALAKTDLESIATKQMRQQRIPYKEIFGQDTLETRTFVSLVEVIEMVNKLYDVSSDYFLSESDNDPTKQIGQLENLIKKLRPLFRRDPIGHVDGLYDVDFDSIGIQVDYDSDREEDIDEDTGEVYPPTQYAFFTDEAKKEMKEWVDLAKELYKHIDPVAKAKRLAQEREKEQKQKRDDAQYDLRRIAKRQLNKEKEVRNERYNAQSFLQARAEEQKYADLQPYRDKLAAAKPKRDAAQKSLRNIARVQMRNEAQQRAEATQPIRDTTQSQLAALAKAQKVKQSRPAPVRRGKKNTGESL